MSFNAGNIRQCADEIRNEIKNLQRAFRSNWNDEVHASFDSYISICLDNGNKLNLIASKCEKFCNELNKLKIDEKLKIVKKKSKESDELSKEANSLCERSI